MFTVFSVDKVKARILLVFLTLMLTELVVTRWESKAKDFASMPCIDVDRVGSNTLGKHP